MQGRLSEDRKQSASSPLAKSEKEKLSHFQKDSFRRRKMVLAIFALCLLVSGGLLFYNDNSLHGKIRIFKRRAVLQGVEVLNTPPLVSELEQPPPKIPTYLSEDSREF